ncbi:MAG: hypothetical protein KKD01_20285, partial [Proteobacteria bacterium]|nr:hypothetical protein [Pseudomonadota bacterium]
QIIDTAVQRMQADVSTKAKWVGSAFSTKVQPLAKYLEDINSSEAKARDASRLIGNALVAPYRAIGNLTWLGDNVQRMATFLTLKEEHGDTMTDAQIGQWVADIHGAYGKTSAAYRRIGGRIFFVHTFRLLMPTRIFKGFTDFPRMLVENTRLKGDQKYTGKELKAAAQAMAGTVGLPIATYMLMTANGWEPDDEGLPEWWVAMKAKIPIGLPFPTYLNYWKFKKTIVTPDGQQKEVVAGVNNIVNMPVKWIERLTKDRPEKLDDLTYHLANLFKWEVNPLYRIMLDVIENEASIGEKPPVDRSRPVSEQIFQAGTYMFGNALRIYGGVVRPNTTTAQKRQVRQELDKSLNIAEKIFLGYYTGYTGNKFVPLQAGYTYTRPERRRRLGSALRSLERSISGEKNQVKTVYRDKPAEMAERLRDLNAIERERKIRLRKIFLGEQI